MLLELGAVLGFDYSTVLQLPEHLKFTRIKPWNNPNILRDDELIYRHQPGFEFSGETQGDLVPLLGIATDRFYPIDIRYDRWGFRNREDREQADVVLIGDSFIEAGLVPDDALVSERLAVSLGITTVNLGVSGYGPQQELVVLKRYGLTRNPRFVLWFFFEGNDLRDAGRYERFQRNPERYMSSGQAFAARSLVTNVLHVLSVLTEPTREKDAATATRRSCGFTNALLPDERRIYFAFEGRPLGDDELLHFKAVKDSLTTSRDEAAGSGAELVLVYVPIKFRVFDGLCEIPAGGLLADWVSHDLPEQMALFAAQESISFLDLTPAMRAVVKGGRSPHMPDDGHWNATGHAAVANELSQFLARDEPR